MVNRRCPVDRGTASDPPVGPVSTAEVAAPADTVEDPPAVHYDDEERPARALPGRVGAGVSAVAFAVALLVLWQVFRPLAQGSQYYLIVFLAGTLPLAFLVYRSGLPGAARRHPNRPTAGDWVLAVATLLVCLYPLNPLTGGYNGFLDRQGLLDTSDIVAGAVLLVLV